MVFTVVIMLLLLGFHARSKTAGKGGKTYFWTALFLALIEAFFLYCIIMSRENAYGDVSFSIFSLIWLLPFLLLIWAISFLPDNWYFRSVLAVWLAIFLALFVWGVYSYYDSKDDYARTNANLLRCGEILKAGKRAELRDFFDKQNFGDRRLWNAAFETTFPQEGGTCK